VALVLSRWPWRVQFVREMERFSLKRGAGLARHRARGAHALHDRRLRRAPSVRDTTCSARRRKSCGGFAGAASRSPARRGADVIIDPRSRRENGTVEIAESEGVEADHSRIWVVTRDLRVLALAGSLRARGGRK